MSESMPTTAYLRESYAREKHPDLPDMIQLRREGFDRWLSEHDRQVAERARVEFADELTRKGAHTFDIHSIHRAAKGEQKLLDPKPWLFISDQVFGEFRSDHDEGYHGVSGAYWAFSPRPDYSQNREDYAS